MISPPSPSLRTLKAATGLCVGCAVAAVVWVVFWPIDAPGTGEAATRSSEPSLSSSIEPLQPAAGSSATIKSIDYLAACDWQRPLRWATVAPPKKTQTPRVQVEAAPSSNQLSLSLLGTMIEPDRSFALLQDAMGQTDLQPVGGILRLEPEGVRIAQIFRDHVVLDHRSRQIKVDMSSPAVESSAGPTETKDSFDPESPEPAPEFTDIQDELDWLNGALPESPESPDLEEREDPSNRAQDDPRTIP